MKLEEARMWANSSRKLIAVGIDLDTRDKAIVILDDRITELEAQIETLKLETPFDARDHLANGQR